MISSVSPDSLGLVRGLLLTSFKLPNFISCPRFPHGLYVYTISEEDRAIFVVQTCPGFNDLARVEQYTQYTLGPTSLPALRLVSNLRNPFFIPTSLRSFHPSLVLVFFCSIHALRTRISHLSASHPRHGHPFCF
jgi:hypothetical protein